MQLHGGSEVYLHEFPFSSRLIRGGVGNEKEFVVASNNVGDELREEAIGS